MDSEYSFGSILNTLHHGACRKVLVNGFLSESFPIFASVPQGSPLSSYLFLVSCEPLHQHIRANDKIRGLRLPNGEELKTTL